MGDEKHRKDRLHKLETQLQARQLCWSMDVESARTRTAARVRLKIGEALGAAWQPAVISARTLMVGDTPHRRLPIERSCGRWGRDYSETLAPDDGTLTRISARLEEMAQRLLAVATR